ncbi:hypothetical protein HO133_001363 [Letharia lupina]|uniref:Uncharacterized protein n=1 Tax=Letharia lupina TaxID=560253 RepID=A0A8H6FBF9_9LECA|nr:uncharacterized protein HO133_001363 [Letharia lupina]KAF6222277.1 hypothetical protein HO133_001363 [Letharia lupina]
MPENLEIKVMIGGGARAHSPRFEKLNVVVHAWIQGLKMPTAQHKISCSARPAAAGLWSVLLPEVLASTNTKKNRNVIASIPNVEMAAPIKPPHGIQRILQVDNLQAKGDTGPQIDSAANVGNRNAAREEG